MVDYFKSIEIYRLNNILEQIIIKVKKMITEEHKIKIKDKTAIQYTSSELLSRFLHLQHLKKDEYFLSNSSDSIEDTSSKGSWFGFNKHKKQVETKFKLEILGGEEFARKKFSAIEKSIINGEEVYTPYVINVKEILSINQPLEVTVELPFNTLNFDEKFQVEVQRRLQKHNSMIVKLISQYQLKDEFKDFKQRSKLSKIWNDDIKDEMMLNAVVLKLHNLFLFDLISEMIGTNTNSSLCRRQYKLSEDKGNEYIFFNFESRSAPTLIFFDVNRSQLLYSFLHLEHGIKFSIPSNLETKSIFLHSVAVQDCLIVIKELLNLDKPILDYRESEELIGVVKRFENTVITLEQMESIFVDPFKDSNIYRVQNFVQPMKEIFFNIGLQNVRLFTILKRKKHLLFDRKMEFVCPTNSTAIKFKEVKLDQKSDRATYQTSLLCNQRILDLKTRFHEIIEFEALSKEQKETEFKSYEFIKNFTFILIQCNEIAKERDIKISNLFRRIFDSTFDEFETTKDFKIENFDQSQDDEKITSLINLVDSFDRYDNIRLINFLTRIEKLNIVEQIIVNSILSLSLEPDVKLDDQVHKTNKKLIHFLTVELHKTKKYKKQFLTYLQNVQDNKFKHEQTDKMIFDADNFIGYFFENFYSIENTILETDMILNYYMHNEITDGRINSSVIINDESLSIYQDTNVQHLPESQPISYVLEDRLQEFDEVTKKRLKHEDEVKINYYIDNFFFHYIVEQSFRGQKFGNRPQTEIIENLTEYLEELVKIYSYLELKENNEVYISLNGPYIKSKNSIDNNNMLFHIDVIKATIYKFERLDEYYRKLISFGLKDATLIKLYKLLSQHFRKVITNLNKAISLNSNSKIIDLSIQQISDFSTLEQEYQQFQKLYFILNDESSEKIEINFDQIYSQVLTNILGRVDFKGNRETKKEIIVYSKESFDIYRKLNAEPVKR